MTPEQAERLCVALERIADSLKGPVPVAEPTPEPVGCQHPEKSRVTLGSAEEFECSRFRGGCGYRSPALVASGG